MKDSLPPNYTVLINTLNTSAIHCVDTMELIKESNKITSSLLAYQLLTSTSLELFAKLKLLKKYTKEEKSIKCILGHFYRLGHELDEIFSEKNLGRSFLSASGIEKVEKVEELDVYCYDFFMDNKEVIRTYNPESLKYWLLSGKRSNGGVLGYQSHQLFQLCKKVQEATYNDLILLP